MLVRELGLARIGIDDVLEATLLGPAPDGRCRVAIEPHKSAHRLGPVEEDFEDMCGVGRTLVTPLHIAELV